MIKLLLDVDQLLRCKLNKQERSGIFYLLKEVSEGLLNKKYLEVSFLSFKYSPEVYKKHVQEFPIMQSAKYFYLGGLKDKFKAFLFGKIFVARKEKKKVFALLCKFLKLFTFLVPNIGKLDLNQFDVYQNLVYPAFEMPELIKKSKIKKSIFINDIIEKTRPDFFPSNIEKTLKRLDNIFENVPQDWNIFTNSEYTKKDVLKFYPNLSKNNINVLYLAANENKFFKIDNLDLAIKNKTLNKYNIPNKPYFLSLCSLNPRKNLEFCMSAFITFLKENPSCDANLILAGAKAWGYNKLFEKLNTNEEFKDRIIVTGFIEDSNINIIYNSAYLFVYPSLYEGFGIPTLEAMQCGLPVIASSTSSFPEIVGDNGILINPEKEEELIVAFKNLYCKKELSEELSEKSLKRSKEFSWNRMIDEMINILNK